MLQVYGVDVLDPRTSTRRVAVLLDRLPPEARRFGELWSTESELLAALVDHVAGLSWITMRAHGAKNVPKPRPIPRPGRAVPAATSAPRTAGERRAGTWAEAAATLAGMPGVKVERSDG
jgi:hypothetical protein